MCWIKVTPETMPPDGKTVMATVKFPDGTKHVFPEVRYGEDGWERLVDAINDYWIGIGFAIQGTVTHWMPCPEPAED